MNFLNAGYGSFVSISRVLTVVSPDSTPIKRYINKLRESDMLIDVTFGKATRSLIILDSGQGLLSSLHPDTIIGRVEKIYN